MSVSSTRIRRYPRRLSAASSIAIGALGVGLLAEEPAQLLAIGIELAALALVFLGIESRRGRHPIVGAVLVAAGVGIAGTAAAVAVVVAPSVSARLELLPGMVGLFVLALGALEGGTRGYGRLFLLAGSGLLLVGILASGIVLGAPMGRLLGATVATLVAWDVGEQGISLGEQVGRRARTARAELVHLGGSVLVGAISVGLAVGVYSIGFGTMSTTGLLLLLGAAVILIAALYS